MGQPDVQQGGRNFGPLMCMAARTTIVQVHKFVDLGSIDPERVVTPGIFVDRIVEVADPINERFEIERQKKAG